MTPAVALWASFPHRPYSPDPFPSNWELWAQFYAASQQSGPVPWGDRLAVPARLVWSVDWAFSLELHTELPVGGVRHMTVSWRRRLASISGAAGGWIS